MKGRIGVCLLRNEISAGVGSDGEKSNVGVVGDRDSREWGRNLFTANLKERR